MNNTVSVNNDTESKQEGKTLVWKPVNKLSQYTKDYMEKNYSPGDDYEFQGWCTSKDSKSNGVGGNTGSGTKTGDDTPIGILLGLLGVAAVGGGFAAFGRKKEQK